MAIGIKDLLKPLVKADVARDFYGILGLLIGYTVTFEDGEITPALIDSFIGLLVDKFWNPLVLPALQAVYLDYSFGDWLSLIAWLIYNRPRIREQAGTTTLVVENTAAIFSGTLVAGQIRVRNSISGKTYTNTTGGAIGAYVSGSYPVPPAVLAAYQVALNFEADEAGTASNAQPGDLNATPVSAPSGLRIQTNASPILGSDEETDPNLVTRARVAVTSRSSSGPLGAYLDAARDPVVAFTSRNLPAPTSWGSSAPAILRVRVQQPAGSIPWAPTTGYAAGSCVANGTVLYSCSTPGISAGSGGPTGFGTGIVDGSCVWQYVGTVAVWCASASGASGGDNTNVDSDVGRANVAIQMFVVPPGVTCTVAPAVEQAMGFGTITLDVSAESRVTVEEARATATTALDAFFSTLPIGGAYDVSNPTQGYVFINKVKGILTAGPGVQTASVSVSPNSDRLVISNAVVVPSWTTPINVNIVTQGA